VLMIPALMQQKRARPRRLLLSQSVITRYATTNSPDEAQTQTTPIGIRRNLALRVRNFDPSKVD